MNRKIGSPNDDREPRTAIATKEYVRLVKLLKTASGPSPWYVPDEVTVIGPGGVLLAWREGKLLKPKGKDLPVFMSLTGNDYFRKVSDNRFLVWRPVEKSVRMTLFDSGQLKSLDKSYVKKHALGSSDLPDSVLHDGGNIAEVEIPWDSSPGEHRVPIPEAMRSLDDLSLLAPTMNGGNNSCVLHLDFARGMLRHIDLKWWREGGFDFGYQWITIVTLDPVNGNFVGAGMRLIPFLVDGQSGDFLGWLEPAELVKPESKVIVDALKELKYTDVEMDTEFQGLRFAISARQNFGWAEQLKFRILVKFMNHIGKEEVQQFESLARKLEDEMKGAWRKAEVISFLFAADTVDWDLLHGLNTKVTKRRRLNGSGWDMSFISLRRRIRQVSGSKAIDALALVITHRAWQLDPTSNEEIS